MPALTPPPPAADDRSWGRRAVPRGWWTTSNLADALAVSRWTARRALLASPVPRKLFRRPWRDPVTGALLIRPVWGTPAEAAQLVVLDRAYRHLRRFTYPLHVRLRAVERVRAQARDRLGRWKQQNPDVAIG